MRSRFALIGFFCLAAVAWEIPGAPSEKSSADDTAALDRVVGVEAEGVSGAGLLYAVRESKALVITTNSLLRQDSRPRAAVRVRFRGVEGSFPAYPLEMWNEALDLGVLEVELSGGLLPGFPDPAVGPGWRGGLQVGDAVRPVARPGSEERWASPEELPRVTRLETTELGDAIVHFSFDCTEGWAGGGLFDADWHLVGLISKPEGDGCLALTVETLLGNLRLWRQRVAWLSIEEVRAAAERAAREPEEVLNLPQTLRQNVGISVILTEDGSASFGASRELASILGGRGFSASAPRIARSAAGALRRGEPGAIEAFLLRPGVNYVLLGEQHFEASANAAKSAELVLEVELYDGETGELTESFTLEASGAGTSEFRARQRARLEAFQELAERLLKSL